MDLNRTDQMLDTITQLRVDAAWYKANLLDAVHDARLSGASWADVAAALGVTTQAAHSQFHGQISRREAGMHRS